MFHSDQGFQYTSAELRQYLLERGILQSMSQRGKFWDNVQTKRFFHRLKQEAGIWKMPLRGLKEVEYLALGWVET